MALSDEELLARYQSLAPGPERERLIDELFGRHYRRVGAWCARMTGDRESAVDLAQDVFTRAFRNLDSFRGESKFTTWLYTITRNHCTNVLESRAFREDQGSEPLAIDVVDARELGADQALEQQQAVGVARELMRSCLNETESRVMVLHYAEEMPLDVVTRMLGLTNTSGAKAYVVSAKRKLEVAVRRWRSKAGKTGER